VNARAKNGKTALLAASSTGQAAISNALLSSGANPTVQDDAGTTPLVVASEQGQENMVRVLLRYMGMEEGSLETRDGLVADAPAAAPRSRSGSESAAAQPLQHLELQAGSSGGRTSPADLWETSRRPSVSLTDNSLRQQSLALMKASQAGYEAITRILLRANEANVECLVNTRLPGPDGAPGPTALMEAVGRGYDAVARSLVQARADVHLCRSDGMTALMLATRSPRSMAVIERAMRLVRLQRDSNSQSPDPAHAQPAGQEIMSSHLAAGGPHARLPVQQAHGGVAQTNACRTRRPRARGLPRLNAAVQSCQVALRDQLGARRRRPQVQRPHFRLHHPGGGDAPL
jgi:ankyrin repeat protein